MSSDEAGATLDEKRRRRFQIAVENFIDLYKFIMVLAIGNCVRTLAQRQIQPNLQNHNGLQLNLSTVSVHDGFMFAFVMIFISRWFLGDLTYWKSYSQRNTQIQVTDALNLLINSFVLTYMSFFIGYTYLIACMALFLLVSELAWGLLRWIEGQFRSSDGPLPVEINLGFAVSLLTIVVVLVLVLGGQIPARFPDGAELSASQNFIIVIIFAANNCGDLLVNGRRYLGASENSWGRLTFHRNSE
jgi:hypothetical protein